MNLIKNVEGEWGAAKNRVRGDLDTIQRAFNTLQAKLDALQKQVNTPAPVPAATITPANTVTTYDTDFLRSVSTIPHGGLKGNGTQTNPLGVDVDGSTITLNSEGQLVGSSGGVVVDTAGALDGDGTGGSPLAVRVDGVTITINGSNELEAAGGGSGVVVLEARITITNAQILTLGTVPVVLVPTPGPGFFTQVLWVSTQYHPDGSQPTFYTPGCSGNLFYASSGAYTTGKVLWNLATVVPGSSFDGVFSLGAQTNSPFIVQGVLIGPADCDVVLVGGNNTLAAGGTGSTVEVTIGYTTLAAT